ncbi:MAG: DNA-formamidopyrimidine glycosylase family protein [Acidimicrobiales bacterium]|jgi:formamidopyrimidine-DNA glycosylase|nr:DNA-formamidopyrimidine glycosylase family protein [Acidimicrobiales bacterium]MDP6298505.1 DNA-formamidopyrimidine glycosylase family protein [Acidimicrobiales bacterium]HJM28723.1 DNA-formamidopyrimidine glycosylase family protein [Acidimicrobiales bacterium]HJM96798.1 DNA-formamidopyrimidine glycosylase family protein [Acidimicrobiales bacterium]
MPEGIEVEYYRISSICALQRKIRRITAKDLYFLKGETQSEQLIAVLKEKKFVESRRIGKLLLLDTEHGETVGIRFGMTGRLLVDGKSSIDNLEYSSARNNPEWDRFSLEFTDGGTLSIRDPRRLGGVELNPDTSLLGPDLYEINGMQLGTLLKESYRPIKARLMDQHQIAGLGNLLTDEILWRSSLDPRRSSNSLTQIEKRRLLYHLKRTVLQLTERGGSHTGNLQDHRLRGGRCPKDGAILERHKVGGRTTYSCPEHQS